MGTRGPAPSAARAKLRGRPKAAQQEAMEPRSSYAPEAPADMKPEALKMWHHLLRVTPPGLLTAMDAPVLIMFCETWQHREDMKKRIPKTGMTKGSKGQLAIHPAARAVRELTITLAQLARQLALTPAERARMGASMVASGSLRPASAAPEKETGGRIAHLIGRAGS